MLSQRIRDLQAHSVSNARSIAAVITGPPEIVVLFYLTLEGDAGLSYPWERPPSSTSHTHNLFIVFDSHSRSTETAAHPDGLAFVFMKDPEELVEYLVRDLFPLDPSLQREARRGHDWQTQLLTQFGVHFLMLQDGIVKDAPRNMSGRDYDHESQSALEANVELLMERTKAIRLGHEVTEAQRNNRRLENELSGMRSQLEAERQTIQNLRATAINQERRMTALTRPPAERWEPTESSSSVANVDEDSLGSYSAHLDAGRGEPRNSRGPEQFGSSFQTSRHPFSLDNEGDQNQGIVNRLYYGARKLLTNGLSAHSEPGEEPQQRVPGNATRLADAQLMSLGLRTDERPVWMRHGNVDKGTGKPRELNTPTVVTNRRSPAEEAEDEQEEEDYHLAVAVTC